MKNLLFLFLISLSFSTFSQEKMNNEMVIELSSAGLGDKIIKSKIKSAPNHKFDTTTAGLIALKKGGVSDKVISAIIEYKPQDQTLDIKNVSSEKSKDDKIKESDSMDFEVTSVTANENSIIINEETELHRGDQVKILLPAKRSKDFKFITKKKRVINSELIGTVADVAKTGSSIYGRGPKSINGVLSKSKVRGAARTVKWGSDSLKKIDKLKISKTAKKLAGKEVEIKDWSYNDEMDVVAEIHLGTKKYEILLFEALDSGEVKLVQ